MPASANKNGAFVMPSETAAAPSTSRPRSLIAVDEIRRSRCWRHSSPAVIIFGALAPRRFLSGDTLRAMAFQMPELGILSLAMMIPLMSGGLNLAIIATANLSALVMAAILTHLVPPVRHERRRVIVLALIAGMITTLIIGFLTGVIVAFFGVHPILVTLGTMTLVKGTSVLGQQWYRYRWFSSRNPVPGERNPIWNPRIDDSFPPLRNVVGVILTHAPFGVSVRFIGSNERATRYSGVATEWVLVGVYASRVCSAGWAHW